MKMMFKTDADLLTRSNDWLKTQLKLAQEEKDKIQREISLLSLILQIKTEMYKRGLVAVQKFERDENGELEDIAVSILNAKEALNEIAKNGNDENAQLYKMAQLMGWEKDGYQIAD